MYVCVCINIYIYIYIYIVHFDLALPIYVIKQTTSTQICKVHKTILYVFTTTIHVHASAIFSHLSRRLKTCIVYIVYIIYIYIYVCVCVYVCVYIYIYMYMYIESIDFEQLQQGDKED